MQKSSVGQECVHHVHSIQKKKTSTEKNDFERLKQVIHLWIIF